MNLYRNTDGPGSTLPGDLITLREASQECGVHFTTLKGWIYKGKGGRKLSTYRKPDKPDLPLVSRASVLIFKDKRTGKVRRVGHGRISITIDDASSLECRELAALMSARVGVQMSIAEVMRSAISGALKLERLRKTQAEANVEAGA